MLLLLQELISINSLFRCLEMDKPPWALGWPSTMAAMLPFRCLAIKVSGIEDIYMNMFWCFGRHPGSQGTIRLYGDQNWLNALFCVKPFSYDIIKNACYVFYSPLLLVVAWRLHQSELVPDLPTITSTITPSTPNHARIQQIQ